MVEWKKLGEVCASLTKSIIKQGDLVDDGAYPVINSGVSLYGRLNDFNNEGNAFTLASRGEYAGYISYLSERFWAGGLCYPYRSQNEEILNTKFAYQYLKKKERYIMDTLVMRGGIPALNKADVDKMLIPIPSLSEQARIVEQLDMFTMAIGSLKEQLELRRKQYEYYRDQLLDLEGKEGVEMKTIGDLFVFKNGLNKEKQYFGQGNPIVNYTDVYHNIKITKGLLKGKVELSDSEIDRYRVHKGDVFFTRTSETKEEVGYAAVMLEEVDNCTFSGFLLRARPTTTLLMPDYCAYCFGSYQVRQEIIKSSTLTTRALTNGGVLSKISFPVPALSEQQRIVSILDTFEASIRNLEEQIKEREKQYEYYRNQLLTFE